MCPTSSQLSPLWALEPGLQRQRSFCEVNACPTVAKDREFDWIGLNYCRNNSGWHTFPTHRLLAWIYPYLCLALNRQFRHRKWYNDLHILTCSEMAAFQPWVTTHPWTAHSYSCKLSSWCSLRSSCSSVELCKLTARRGFLHTSLATCKEHT